MSVSNYLKQQWSRNYRLDRNFFDSDFIGNVRYVQDEFVRWLKEMENNRIGFSPFGWDNASLFDIVKGISPSRSVLSALQKGNYELFDLMLDYKQASSKSVAKEQIFMELFFQSTNDIVQNKLNI